jgi:biotin carboxyl carrier protein
VPHLATTAIVIDDVVHMDLVGRSVAFRLAAAPDVDRSARAATTSFRAGGPVDVLAPMPGAVLTVHVAPGATVAVGDPIVTLEAMKMEHVVAAAADGVIADITVVAADQVTRGQRLATIEPGT